jgi:SAM-dependent methyltransferase
MAPTQEADLAGQAAFTRTTLAFYDWLLELTCNRIWRCPIEQTLELYQAHVSSSHLEVGVGTGYFLDRIKFPAAAPKLALLDLNPHCLSHTAKRLRRYAPEVYRANALKPIEVATQPFGSVAINYVLHCMPGALSEKGVVFANLKPLIKPGGILFGSTVLRLGVPCDLRARAFMRLYNAYGVFCNLQDNLADLKTALESRYTEVRIDVVGCVASFTARA